jgi:hypothetical protein
MRNDLTFRPQVEQSETRMLLSAAGAAHAATVGAQVGVRELRDVAAWSIGPTLREHTPIYSFYVQNGTGSPLDIAISASDGRLDIVPHESPPPLGNLGTVLLFTDDPKNTFTLTMTPANDPAAPVRYELHTNEARVTSLANGFRLPSTYKDYYADAGHAARFDIVIQGTARGNVLRVVRA